MKRKKIGRHKQLFVIERLERRLDQQLVRPNIISICLLSFSLGNGEKINERKLNNPLFFTSFRVHFCYLIANKSAKYGNETHADVGKERGRGRRGAE